MSRQPLVDHRCKTTYVATTTGRVNNLRLNDDKSESELITFHKDKTEMFIDSVQVGHTLTHRVCNVRNLGFYF